MKERIRVLHLEDDAAVSKLIRIYLENAHYKVDIKRVDDEKSFLKALELDKWDCIIADYQIRPPFDGMKALKKYKAYNYDIPFIIFSGKIGEEKAVELMRLGAHDYINKENDKRLVAVIQRELKESKSREEKRKTERELKIAKDKAEESNRLKANILLNFSHEFRTPMNAILGFSSLIISDSKEDEILSFAKKINESGQRLLNTLIDLTELSTLQSGKSISDLSNENLSDIVKEIDKKFITQAKSKGLNIVYSDCSSVFSLINKSYFIKAVEHILENAIKFTNKGKITISVGSQTIKRKLYNEVRIADTGIGIPKEKMAIIFEAFRQGSEGRSRVYEGIGLGLTIAKRIINQMKGSISVTSTENEGSIFIIRLPSS